MENPPIIDLPLLKLRLLGDQALLREVAQIMCEDIEQRGFNLRQALQSGDMVLAKNEAHALKGGLGSVTAMRAADAASDLVRLAVENNWSTFAEKLVFFESEVEQVMHILKRDVIGISM